LAFCLLGLTIRLLHELTWCLIHDQNKEFDDPHIVFLVLFDRVTIFDLLVQQMAAADAKDQKLPALVQSVKLELLAEMKHDDEQIHAWFSTQPIMDEMIKSIRHLIKVYLKHSSFFCQSVPKPLVRLEGKANIKTDISLPFTWNVADPNLIEWKFMYSHTLMCV
jgi:hypothetical protein